MSPTDRVKPGYLVLAIYPNGNVERLETRQEIEWAKAEGIKPLVLKQAEPQEQPA